MKNKAILILALSMACGGAFDTASLAPVDQTFASGQRLRAVVLDGGDGAMKFLRWHDTKLDADCTFEKAADGSWRCLPGATTSVGFTDAACTSERVAIIRGSPPPYVLSDGDPDCAEGRPRYPRAVWTVGAERTGTFHYASAGGCHEAPVSDPSAHLHAITAGDTGMFVRAELRRDARGDDLDAEVLFAEDGSKQLVGAIDRKRALACQTAPGPRPASGSERRCLPANALTLDAYSDAACTDSKAAMSVEVDCGDPPVAIEETSPSCSERDYRVWSLGPREPSEAFTSSVGGACKTSSAPLVLFPKIGEVPNDAFPTLRVAMFGRGRLQLPLATALADERPISPLRAIEYSADAFWDNARSFYCYPEKFADGVTRCVVENVGSIVLPGTDASSTYNRYYGDPSCKTQQLANRHSGCGDPIYAVVHDSKFGSIGARPIKKRYAARTYWMTSDATGACREYGQGGDDLFEVGDLLAPDDVFARVTERTE